MLAVICTPAGEPYYQHQQQQCRQLASKKFQVAIMSNAAAVFAECNTHAMIYSTRKNGGRRWTVQFSRKQALKCRTPTVFFFAPSVYDVKSIAEGQGMHLLRRWATLFLTTFEWFKFQCHISRLSSNSSMAKKNSRRTGTVPVQPSECNLRILTVGKLQNYLFELKNQINVD